MLQIIKHWVKSLVESFEKPTTYGSALEAYIVSNNPQNECDVDRLAREYNQRQHAAFDWARGY